MLLACRSGGNYPSAVGEGLSNEQKTCLRTSTPGEVLRHRLVSHDCAVMKHLHMNTCERTEFRLAKFNANICKWAVHYPYVHCGAKWTDSFVHKLSCLPVCYVCS